jgi:flagellar biosynthesis/type III secretory pathway protein FliH
VSSSSRDVIKFSTAPKRVLLALADPASDGAPGRSHIKDLQRRAFERGVAVEREQWTKKIEKLAAQVSSHVQSSIMQRTASTGEIEEFAVRLALVIAEDLTRAAVDESRHDVRAMVAEVVAEIGGRGVPKRLEIRMHPDDHAHLVAAMAEKPAERSWAEATLIPDSSLARGSFIVTDEDSSFYSIMSERLEGLRTRLLDSARTAHA